ncbi:Crp/Fnr family transcriptional regulator [Methylobrevis albus]|uniref:Crp/Fnr family transcriptional regulator n=1 Tax=Methylobrevis albus TaxID=2793297 RepID=A0A931I1H1_9HYPH|nr:Crp/Fnr family transcriptional regulator [Methylobrevis albus]MBH0237526.1 Crp/Fnr family transcriptional regulator [Methylobrevis albus]
MSCFDTSHLVRSIVRRAELSSDDIALIEALDGEIVTVRPGTEIVPAQQFVQHSCLVISGLAARVQRFGERRQISAVNVPGDFVDVHSLVLRKLEHSVVALSECTIARVPHAQLRAATETSPRLGRALWMLTAIEAAVHRTWIASLGRRSSIEHMAHFFCEMRLRLGLVGLVEADAFTFPVTQVDLADVLGLTPVHVNRSLKQLREGGMLVWRDRSVALRDIPALEALAAFDPTYLSLDQMTR